MLPCRRKPSGQVIARGGGWGGASRKGSAGTSLCVCEREGERETTAGTEEWVRVRGKMLLLHARLGEVYLERIWTFSLTVIDRSKLVMERCLSLFV